MGFRRGIILVALVESPSIVGLPELLTVARMVLVIHLISQTGVRRLDERMADRSCSGLRGLLGGASAARDHEENAAIMEVRIS